MFYDVQAGFFVLSNFYNNETTPRRNVKKYEMEIVEKCTGSCFINDNKFIYKKSGLVFSKPGDVRFTTGELECRFLKFKCDDEEICKILDSIDSGIISVDTTELAEVMIQAKKVAKSESEIDKMLLMSLICKAISLLCQYYTSPEKVYKKANDVYTNRIINAKEYVDKHFDEKITLETLSAITFLSPNFFRTKFQEIIGISAHEYLVQVRISNAKRMLLNDEYSLAQIASSCGFESQSYMNYIFRKETGTSPGKFRRKSRV